MFRNRWGALLFVAMTATGAATLVGDQEDQGVLLEAAQDIRQQKVAMEAAVPHVSSPPIVIPPSAEVEFTSDEELIDDAAGFDPTPAEEGKPLANELVPHDEVVIVSRDVGEAGQ